MASKWDDYEVKDTSRWDKYAVKTPEGQQVPFAKQDLWAGTGEQWKETGKGFVFGAGNIPVGLKQLDTQIRSSLGISPESQAEEYNKYVTERAATQGTSPEFKLGKTAGEFAVTAPIPGGAGKATLPLLGKGFLSRLLTSTAQGAGIGAMQPVPEGESRATNILVGGTAGAGGQTAVSTGGKFLNLFKPVEKGTAELGKKFGTRLSLGDITQNPRIQKAEILLEDIPLIGTGRFRKGQSADTSKLAGQVLAGYSIDPAITSTKAIKDANDIFLDNMYQQLKATGKELYPKNPEELKSVVPGLIEQYPSVFESVQDNHVKKILRDISGGTKSPADPYAILSEIQQQGQKSMNPATFTFDELWTLRKGLGKEIGDAKTDTAKGVLNQLYGAVSRDIDNMVDKAGGSIGKDFKHANEEFKRLSVKFDVIRDAYDKAIGTTSAKEVFSPKTFSTSLKKLVNDPNYKGNIKWNTEEVDYLTGVASIMQYAKRAGEYMERPPTGMRTIPILMGGQAAGLVTGGASSGSIYPFAALGTEATLAGLATVLTTTEVGKRIALNASKLEVRNPKFMALINEAYQQIPKLGAISATQENKQSGFQDILNRNKHHSPLP